MSIKDIIKRIPVINTLAHAVLIRQRNQTFVGSDTYWENRYQQEGTSGSGSYNRLAMFKADTINAFITENQVQSVIEFGCGDGNQLSFMNYPSYIGLDVSLKAIEICKTRFKEDASKSFFLYHSLAFHDNAQVFNTQLSLSLDVIYHLIETNIYTQYMRHLFDSSTRYVIIYSSDYDAPQTHHVKHHKFSDWVAQNRPQWRLIRKIDNLYPYEANNPNNTSLADFYIYEKL